MTRLCPCGDTCEPGDAWRSDDEPDRPSASDIGDMQRDWDQLRRVSADPWKAP